MVRRRGPRPAVREMNRRLSELGLKKQGSPLGTRRIDNEQSIPQMYPTIKNPSRWRRVGGVVPIGNFRTGYRLRKASRKGGHGKGGGGVQILGKGARKTGTARARRTSKPGGTRGAFPGREKRK